MQPRILIFILIGLALAAGTGLVGCGGSNDGIKKKKPARRGPNAVASVFFEALGAIEFETLRELSEPRLEAFFVALERIRDLNAVLADFFVSRYGDEANARVEVKRMRENWSKPIAPFAEGKLVGLLAEACEEGHKVYRISYVDPYGVLHYDKLRVVRRKDGTWQVRSFSEIMNRPEVVGSYQTIANQFALAMPHGMDAVKRLAPPTMDAALKTYTAASEASLPQEVRTQR